MCKGLIGLHAYTGCDTVSAFAGKGKVNSVKILKSDKYTQDAFAQLGQNLTLSQDLFDEMEKFTCALYTPGASTGKINDARYNLFCAKNGEIESHQLPLVTTAFVNIQCVPITKLVSGGGAWRATLVFQVPMEMAGS